MEATPRTGDLVKIAVRLEEPHVHPHYIEDMRPWLGKTVLVDGASDCECGKCVFIKEDPRKFHWHPRWLTPVNNAGEVAGLKPGRYIRLDQQNQAVCSEIRRGDSREYELRKVQLNDVLEALRKREVGKMATPILPPNTRYYIRRGDSEILVIEQPPRVRLVRAAKGNKFNLSFPYVVYLFYFTRGEMPRYTSRMFYRNAPIKSLDDKLFSPNLTHMVTDKGHRTLVGTVCMSADPDSAGSLEEKITANLTYYWDSPFHLERTGEGGHEYFVGNLQKIPDERMKDFKKWEEEGAKDPLFVLTVPWKDLDLTLGDAIKESLGEERDRGAVGFDDLLDMLYRAREVQ